MPEYFWILRLTTLAQDDVVCGSHRMARVGVRSRSDTDAAVLKSALVILIAFFLNQL